MYVSVHFVSSGNIRHTYMYELTLSSVFPFADSGDVKKDLGHILDFITRAKHLQVFTDSFHYQLTNEKKTDSLVLDVEIILKISVIGLFEFTSPRRH